MTLKYGIIKWGDRLYLSSTEDLAEDYSEYLSGGADLDRLDD